MIQVKPLNEAIRCNQREVGTITCPECGRDDIVVWDDDLVIPPHPKPEGKYGDRWCQCQDPL